MLMLLPSNNLCKHMESYVHASLYKFSSAKALKIPKTESTPNPMYIKFYVSVFILVTTVKAIRDKVIRTEHISGLKTLMHEIFTGKIAAIVANVRHMTANGNISFT